MSLISSPSRLLFLMSAILGTIITASSSTWLACWMGLELNLLSFIPIMSSSQNLYKSEAALKYFLIQALGSAIILSWSPSLLIFSHDNALAILLLAILLKMGAAPFHLWLPSVMQGLHWPQCLILMTLQKIAPLTMLLYLTFSQLLTTLILLSSSLSAIVGGLAGINQTLTRKILAYSSINHIGWMLSTVLLSEWITIYYFMIYAAISSSIVMILHYQQVFHLSSILSTSLSSSSQIILSLSLLSLAGLPPFLGFLPKMLVINTLAQDYLIWSAVLTMSSLLTLYFYIRILIPPITLSSPKSKFNTLIKKSPTLLLSSNLLNLAPILGPLVTFPPF
nr:NADH dehydrogenase subunit 2 [Exhippolysmata ensirostris]